MESLKSFNFDDWRQRYVAFTRTNKLKYMDFFRRLDREGTGLVTRRQFIEAVLSSSTCHLTVVLMFCFVYSRKMQNVHDDTGKDDCACVLIIE